LSYIISDDKFLIIRKQQLEYFLKLNHFSQEEQDKVKEIKQYYTKADILFFFLNYAHCNYTVELFSPVFYSNNTNNVCFCDEIKGVLCIPSVPVDLVLKSWRKEEVNEVIWLNTKNTNWQKKYGFGIQEDDMPLIQIDISLYSKEPVTYRKKSGQTGDRQLEYQLQRNFWRRENQLRKKMKSLCIMGIWSDSREREPSLQASALSRSFPSFILSARPCFRRARKNTYRCFPFLLRALTTQQPDSYL